MKLHVLDGSASTLSVSELTNLEDNIRYHHLPIPLLDRLFFATDLVETDYVLFSCDDDFFVPSALDRLAQQLDQRVDLVACGGRVLTFDFLNDEVVASPAYPRFAGRYISGTKPSERMQQHMATYQPSTYYSLIRVDAWRRAVRFAAANPLPFYASFEIQIELALSCLGDSVIDPSLSRLRSKENAPIRNNEVFLDARNDFFRWWQDNSSQTSKDTLVTNFLEEFGYDQHGDSLLTSAEVRNSFEALSDYYSQFHDSLRVRLSEALEHVVPKKARSGLGKVLPRPKTINRRFNTLKTELTHLEQSEIFVERHELAEIESSIHRFYEKTMTP